MIDTQSKITYELFTFHHLLLWSSSVLLCTIMGEQRRGWTDLSQGTSMVVFLFSSFDH